MDILCFSYNELNFAFSMRNRIFVWLSRIEVEDNFVYFD